jgi:hypothetical protein
VLIKYYTRAFFSYVAIAEPTSRHHYHLNRDYHYLNRDCRYRDHHYLQLHDWPDFQKSYSLNDLEGHSPADVQKNCSLNDLDGHIIYQKAEVKNRNELFAVFVEDLIGELNIPTTPATSPGK